jgi:GxxExxY protein
MDAGWGYYPRDPLAQRVTEAGFEVAEEVRFRVYFRGQIIGEFYADVVVNGLVLVEVKSRSALEPRDRAQAMNYLRASDLEVALILNFGPRREVQRVIVTNDRKERPKERPESPDPTAKNDFEKGIDG